MVIAEVECLGAVQPERYLDNRMPVGLIQAQNRVVFIFLLLLADDYAIVFLPVALSNGPGLGQRAAGKVILVDDLTGTGQVRFEVGASGGEARAPLKKS